MDEGLNMGIQDRDRLHIVRNVLDNRFTQVEAAKMLGLSDRQVRRICAEVRRQGDRAILHGLCGRPSNNRHDPELLGKALSAFHNPRWHDFGPTYCLDKIKDFYGIVLGEGTVRKLMILTGLWTPHRRGRKHRAWRERRRSVGMLIQLDGSDHDWFEGRGPRCVLIIYIDDATSRILYGEFVNVEDTLTLLRTTKAYLKRWGRPIALYVDKDSIYKVNRQATVEEELRDEQPITQFTRAMAQLGVDVIAADSPQAKGRVERGFDTHQDRLVKDLRLANISTKEAANVYLRGVYIPDHNRRYARPPADPLDVHRSLLPAHDLKSVLAIHLQRQVQNDFTIRYRHRFFQIERKQPVRVYPKAQLTVQERLDGSIHLVFRNHRLNFHSISERPSPPAPAAKLNVAVVVRKHRRQKVDPFFLGFSLRSNVPTNPPASALLQS